MMDIQSLKKHLDKFVKSITPTLTMFISMIMDKKRKVKLIVNYGQDSFTDGKMIQVSLPKKFYNVSASEKLMVMRAIAGHEKQHIDSSDFIGLGVFLDEVSQMFFDKYNIPKKKTTKIAQFVLNSIEDGRIEMILGKNYPGAIRDLKYMNAMMFRDAKLGESTLWNFLNSVLTVAKTGLRLKGFNEFYKDTPYIVLMDEIEDIVYEGVYAITAKDCIDECWKIIHLLEDVINEELNSDDEKLKDLINELMKQIQDNPDWTTSEETETNEDDGNSNPVHFKKKKPPSKQPKKDKVDEKTPKSKKTSKKDEENPDDSGDDESDESEDSKGSKDQKGSDENDSEDDGDTDGGEDSKDDESKGSKGSDESNDSEDDNAEDSNGSGGSKEDDDVDPKDSDGSDGSDESDDSEDDDTEDGNGSGGSKEDDDEDPKDSDGSDGSDESDDSDESENDAKDDPENSKGSDGSDSDDSDGDEDSKDSKNSNDSSDGDSDSNDNSKDSNGDSNKEDSSDDNFGESDLEDELNEIIRDGAKEFEGLTKPKKDEESVEDICLSPEDLSDIIKNYRDDGHVAYNEKTNELLTDDLPMDIKIEARRFEKAVEEIMRNKKVLSQRGQKSGLLDASKLHRIGVNDYNVFMKKGHELLSEYAGYILKDNSGSMNGEKDIQANKACAIMEDGLKNLMPLKIASFSAESRNKVQHYIMKNFTQKSNKNFTYNYFIRRRADGGNKDGFSIRVATKELLKRGEKVKILFILSDGLPSAYRQDIPAGISDVKSAVQEARRKGIHVICIMFGTEYERMINAQRYKEMYEKNIISVPPEQITRMMTTMMKQILKH